MLRRSRRSELGRSGNASGTHADVDGARTAFDAASSDFVDGGPTERKAASPVPDAMRSCGDGGGTRKGDAAAFIESGVRGKAPSLSSSAELFEPGLWAGLRAIQDMRSVAGVKENREQSGGRGKLRVPSADARSGGDEGGAVIQEVRSAAGVNEKREARCTARGSLVSPL